MTKLTVVSDLHGDYYLLDLKPADILIICGDIGIWNQADLWQFDRWLEKQLFEYKVCIGGNHDKFLFECGPKSVQKQLTNAIYLENSGCEIRGLKIWGSPITPTFLNWYFMAERDEIKKYWDQISIFSDIIITHGPPNGILDYAVFSKQHVGCEALLERIKFIKPRYHVFGHIHYEGGKIYKTEHTTFINASLMNENYQLVNKPVEIEI